MENEPKLYTTTESAKWSLLGLSGLMGAYQPPQQARLTKRAGFKNLLQKSVTIVPHEHVEETDDVNVTREHHSKSIQVDLDSPSFFRPYKPSAYSPSLSRPERQAPGHSRQTSYLGSINEQENSNPGTSRFMATQSSMSVLSQMDERYFQRHESSLVVVYSGGDKSRGHSMTSAHPHVQGSQGSRRLSDETVLLIEDYHSYDERNVARRQETGNVSRSMFLCCFRKTRPEMEVLSRPLPLQPTSSLDDDEKFCRICHEGSEVEPLMQPCLCKGSVGSVHAKCLKAWLEQSSTSRCELCNYPYAIRQTRKYSTCVSIRVFYKSVFDKRAAAYDVTSFIIITPLTLVGVVMCIKASLFSKPSIIGESSFQMNYVTKVGMIMLSGTIIIAYLVWLYTLASFHYKAWRKWYNTCYDVEVIPVQMTSEERIQAAREFCEEMRINRGTAEYPSPLLAVPRSSHRHFYQTPATVNNSALISEPDR